MPRDRRPKADFDDMSSTPLMDLAVRVVALVSIAGGSLAVLGLAGYSADGHGAWAAYDGVILVLLVAANVSLLLVRRRVRRRR